MKTSANQKPSRQTEDAHKRRLQRVVSLRWLIVTRTHKQWCSRSREHFTTEHDHEPVLQYHDGKVWRDVAKRIFTIS